MKQMFFKEDAENDAPVTMIEDGKGKNGRVYQFEGTDYPLIVLFDDGSRVSFQTNGKRYVEDNFRSLFHGHNVQAQITGEEVPERFVVKYVNVWMKNNRPAASPSPYDTGDEALRNVVPSGYHDYIATAVPIKIKL